METNKLENKMNNGKEWLQMNWPNARKVDHDWTMERYDYPPFVRQYIKENWITVSNENGGTYAEPVWWEAKKKKLKNKK